MGFLVQFYNDSLHFDRVIIYVTPESESHGLYMEISRLLFDGTPNIHLANFLHMITTMTESGSPEAVESFILNSQNVPNLPGDEPMWALSSVSLCEDGGSLENSSFSATRKVVKSFQAKRRAGVTSTWPPSDWKSAPGSVYSPHSQVKAEAVTVTSSTCLQVIKKDSHELTIESGDGHEASADVTSEEVVAVSPSEFSVSYGATDVGNLDSSANQIDTSPVSDPPQLIGRTMLSVSMPDPEQAMLVGKLGELVAFKHLAEKFSQSSLTWVNENGETGLAYDITIEDREGLRYIEVKTTQSEEKDWFSLSINK